MGVAKNTVINMGEDLTMLLGYSLVNQYLHEKLSAYFPDEIDENGNAKQNIALEVLSGGASFLFMSGMMEIIRREERFIEYLFAAGEAIITVLYLRNKGAFESIGNRIKSMKGVKALNRLKLFDSQTDPTNSFISQVYQAMQVILHGRNSSSDVAGTIQASNSSQDTAINREAHNLKFAELNNKSFNDSLMIKTITGTFMQADEIILRKVIGRDNFQSVPLSHEELNQVHEFMFIKDSNGKLIGMAKGFIDLVNGLGFINK